MIDDFPRFGDVGGLAIGLPNSVPNLRPPQMVCFSSGSNRNGTALGAVLAGIGDRSLGVGWDEESRRPAKIAILMPTDAQPTAPDFSRGIDFDGQILLPAIVQDADSGEVLMMAWMNQPAYRRTLATGRANYYSRSRGEFWQKGDSSGHIQVVREVRVDCDRDVILLKVEQTGAACHTGARSCFYDSVDVRAG